MSSGIHVLQRTNKLSLVGVIADPVRLNSHLPSIVCRRREAGLIENERESQRAVLDLSEVGAGDVALVGGQCAIGRSVRALVPRVGGAVDALRPPAKNIADLQTDVGVRLRELLRKLITPNQGTHLSVVRRARSCSIIPCRQSYEAIMEAYQASAIDWGACRSSRTLFGDGERSPEASFAGQQTRF